MLTQYSMVLPGHKEVIKIGNSAIEVTVLSCKINDKFISVNVGYEIFGDKHIKSLRTNDFVRVVVMDIHNIGVPVHVAIKGHLIYGIVRVVEVLSSGKLVYTVSYEPVHDDEQLFLTCDHSDIKELE